MAHLYSSSVKPLDTLIPVYFTLDFTKDKLNPEQNREWAEATLSIVISVNLELLNGY
jgi:hypothetical protein